jgi:hypothetical protein
MAPHSDESVYRKRYRAPTLNYRALRFFLPGPCSGHSCNYAPPPPPHAAWRLCPRVAPQPPLTPAGAVTRRRSTSPVCAHLTTTGAGVARGFVGVAVRFAERGVEPESAGLWMPSSSLGSKMRASGSSECSPVLGGLPPDEATSSPSGLTTHKLPCRPPVPAFSQTSCTRGYTQTTSAFSH